MFESDPPTDRVARRRFLARSFQAGAAATGLLATVPDRRVRARTPSPRRVVTPAEPQPVPPLRVRVWCEGTAPRSVYPNDIDAAIGESLARNSSLNVQRARISDPDAGLSEAALDATDVLVWWGHLRHDDVPLDRARAVVSRVKAGRLGLVALHSSCGSRPFKMLMGMSCEPGGWREDGRPEHIRVEAPDHPVARGVSHFTIPRSDMFAEPFNVPSPENVVLISSWDQGETVRSGLTWSIDKGRVVYLRTGHEAFPVLFHPSVRQLVANACDWSGRRT